jgi:hypothetical protein
MTEKISRARGTKIGRELLGGSVTASGEVGHEAHPRYSKKDTGESAGSKGSRYRLSLAQLLTPAKRGWTEISSGVLALARI